MTSTRAAGSHRADAHVAAAVLAITGAALAVCLCMAALGVKRPLNERVVGLVEKARVDGGFRDLPDAWEWAAAGIGAFAVAAVVLHTPGLWRRVLFWLASLVVTFAWAPSLALAAYAPDVAVPCLAVFTAGAGALFYTSRHRMPCDESD